MDYILELNDQNQLPIPEGLVQAAGLKPGTHFEARVEGKRITIEQLPFSSLEQGEMLAETIKDLQRK